MMNCKKQYKLDIIHTQTEFSLGLLGIAIARELRIPVVHTYHTQYEDYVRYIAKGMVIRPSMVKYIVRGFMSDLDGVICPSEIVYDLLLKYKIAAEKRVIPTGLNFEKFPASRDYRRRCSGLESQAWYCFG